MKFISQSILVSMNIHYVDRITKQVREEKVYGRRAISLFYGNSIPARLVSFFLLPLIAHCPLFSRFYGYLQKKPRSQKKILSFIETYHIDISEFADPVDSFASFNDFFIRKLKKESRPIELGGRSIVAPVDGRYLVIDHLKEENSFYVKGQKFNLLSFLQSPELAQKYREGSMVIARLNPTDYHRFHFPISGIPTPAQPIRGPLFSVSPFALKKRFSILWENQRMMTKIMSSFGEVCMVEVGATFVGSIHQTFSLNSPVQKGEEKGFFSFGGSCVILLFEKGRIIFDADLLENSRQNLETKCRFGEAIAKF
jgi:phosphatidylserine decarboxylase